MVHLRTTYGLTRTKDMLGNMYVATLLTTHLQHVRVHLVDESDCALGRVERSAVQPNAAQRRTAQRSTTQHSTAQFQGGARGREGGGTGRTVCMGTRSAALSFFSPATCIHTSEHGHPSFHCTLNTVRTGHAVNSPPVPTGRSAHTFAHSTVPLPV